MRSPRRCALPAASAFTLDELKYRYPDEPVPPGKTAQRHLEDLTWQGVAKYFPDGIDDKLRATLAKGIGADRKTRLRALFSHRARHRPLRAVAAHPVSGQGIGGQFGGVFHAGGHLRQSGRGRSFVRAVSLRRAPRAARYRCRFRTFAPRRGDAICLQSLWPPPRRDCRHRHSLPAAQRDPRRRQGARPDRRRHRPAGRYGVGKLGRWPRRDAGPAGRSRSAQPDDHPRGEARGRTDRISAPSVAACRRLRADPGPARQLSCRSAMPRWTTAPSSNGTRTTSTQSG